MITLFIFQESLYIEVMKIFQRSPRHRIVHQVSPKDFYSPWCPKSCENHKGNQSLKERPRITERSPYYLVDLSEVYQRTRNYLNAFVISLGCT